MRERRGASRAGSPALVRQVQVSRGGWRREEQAGAVRSAGWWESVVVTWSPAPEQPRRSPVLHRVLAAAVDTLGPPAAELVAAGAWRLLERWQAAGALAPSLRRRLPAPARALPRGTKGMP